MGRSDGRPAGNDPNGPERTPGGRDNTKHRGAMAELQFMLDAARRGFGVSKPFVDNERYDVIVDAPRRLWRVQVKASGASHHRGFAVRASWRTSKRAMPYTKEQIDFLAVVVQGERVKGKRIWYLIPVEALGGRLTINLYPFGCRKDGEERFEEFRGAWALLTAEVADLGRRSI
jgi:PD-(D/E)XK nuclease superfamily protein